jgi:hypothetical protein
LQTFDPDFDLLEDFPSVRMENSSKSAVHFDSSIKSVKGSTQKAEKEDGLELSSRGFPADRNHQRPFRVCEEHGGVVRRVLKLKQAELLHGA